VTGQLNQVEGEAWQSLESLLTTGGAGDVIALRQCHEDYITIISRRCLISTATTSTADSSTEDVSVLVYETFLGITEACMVVDEHLKVGGCDVVLLLLLLLLLLKHHYYYRTYH